MKKEFLVNRQGKDFALYAGLLDQAHGEGLKRITTKLIQAPSEENGHLAICYAEVETAKGVFSGIGDASPQNVGRMIALHTVRMAETRAKARALRDAINVGVASLEELGDAGEEGGEDAPLRQQRPVPLRAERAEGPGPEDPATVEQLTRLARLHAAVGQTYVRDEHMTSAAAAAQIASLVEQFNAQQARSRATLTGPAPRRG